MGTLRIFFAGLMVMGMGAVAQHGSKPVKGIDIVVKKQPSGSATLVRTDSNGGFSVRIPEAGTYTLRFAAPPELPGLPGTVRSSITFTGDTPSADLAAVNKPDPYRGGGQKFDKIGTKGGILPRTARRLKWIYPWPWPPRTANGIYSFEELEFSGPGLFSGTLTAHRSLTSLEVLTFVAVEGQLSPLPQGVTIMAEGYRSFEYAAILRSGLERRWRTQLEGSSGAWRGEGEKPELRVSINTSGLTAGTYSDEVVLTLIDGEAREEVRLPISIHILPRGADLGIQVNRSRVVVPYTTGKFSSSFQLHNPTLSAQTYSIRPSPGTASNVFRLPAARITVRSGEVASVPFEIDGQALRDGGDNGGGDFVPQCIEVVKEPGGEKFVYCTLPHDVKTLEQWPETPQVLKPLKLLPVPPPSQPCQATKLYPVLVGSPTRLLQGVGANLQFEVWDDCGLERTDFGLLAFSSLGGSTSAKAISKGGVGTFLTFPSAGANELQIEVRAGELTGEDTYDLEVESTPVPAMKAVTKSGAGQLRGSAQSQSIAPGAIVEAETTPISEAGELLFGRIPIRVLSRQGDVLTFRVPYNTDPSVPQILQVRDGNHTSAPFPLSVAPAVPSILRNAETGAYTFLRGDDGSLTPVTAETRAPAGSTLVVFAEGLGSVEQEATAETPTVVLSTNSKQSPRATNGIPAVKIVLIKPPGTSAVTPTEIALTRDLPIELEGRPEAAFRLTFTLPEGLESADPASGLVNLWVESQGVASELAATYTPDPAPVTSVSVTSHAIPFPATHLWDGVSQTGPRTANEAIGQARTLEGPTPQNLAPGVRLRLADLVSNTVNATAPNGNKWDIVVPNSASPVDYTAIYEKEFQLTFVVNPPACGTLSTGALASPGNWWPEGSTVPLSRTVNAGWTVVSILGGTTSSSTLMDRPRTVTMTCEEGYPVTLRVAPLHPALVQIDSKTSTTGSLTTISNKALTLTVPYSYIWGSNFSYFTGISTPALSWSKQPGPNPSTVTIPAPTAAVTYTAHYNVGCIILTPHPNMTVAGGMIMSEAGNPPNCYGPGNVTITATPPPGQCFTAWDDGNTANPRSWSPWVVSAVLPRPLFAPCTPGNTCVSPPAGPGGWWSLETASGPVLDRMPLAMHGIARNNPIVVPGKVGNALAFNGTNSVEIPNNAIFDLPNSTAGRGNFTIDAWVRLDVASDGGVLGRIGSPGPAGGLGWAFSVSRSGQFFEIRSGATGFGVQRTHAPVSLGGWHFVALRFLRTATGSDVTMWINGEKSTYNLADPVAALNLSGEPLLLASAVSPSAIGLQKPFVGAIDEFEYFQRALTDAEIEGIYRASDKGKCPPAPSTGVRITVNGNPAAVGAVAGAAFGATGLGAPSAPTFTTVLPTGTTSLAITAATPVTNTAAGIRYEFTNWSVNGTANPAWTATPQAVPVPTANTTYTANYRTLFEVKVVVNGTCTVSPTPGFYPARTQLPVVITPATGPTATWAFDGGSLTVVSGGRIPLLSPGTLTVNCSASTGVPISVITNPASIGAMVGIDTVGSSPNTYNTSLPAGGMQTLTAQDPVISAGTLYRFDNWSPTGPQITVPSTGPAVFTANYRLRGYAVTLTGCGATIGPLSLAVQTNPLFFAPNAELQIFPNPPAGQTFTSFTITMGGTTTTQTTNPGRITLTGPATIVANCGTPTTAPVTVLTNPANIGATMGLAGVNPGAGSSLNQYSTNAVPGATGTVNAAPVQIFNSANTTRWDFKNWTGAGVVAPGTNNPQPVTIQPNGSTFVANYDTFYKVDVVNNGCASVSPVAGFYPAGSNVTVTVVAGGSNQVSSITFGPPAGGGAAPSPIQNNSVMPVNSYTILTANCGATPTGTVTVNTNPANLGVVVGVTGSGAAPNSFTAANLPAGPVTVTVDMLGPIVTPQGQQYQLQRWRQVGGGTLGSAAAQPATVVAGVTTTYTADYTVTGNRVTLLNNGCTAVGTTPTVPANGIWPVSTALTGLTATPPTGGTLTNVTVTVLDPATGQTLTVPLGFPLPSPQTIGMPWTITFNCAAATTIGVTVNTNPVAIGATVGIGAASGVNSVSATLPAGSAQTLTASATALVASTGLGYRFNNWTPAGPAVTLPASGSVTYTANYAVACFLVLTEVQPAGSGTITLSPASPANLPPNCYPNGSAITATIVPAAGRLAGTIQPGAAGLGGLSPYSFTITGPTLLVGTTTAAPAPAPNVNWAFVSRTGLTAVFRATNTGNLPATNLRITALTASPGLRHTNRPPLPLGVGTLAPGAAADVTLPFEFIGESLDPNLNAAFQVVLTSQADNLPAASFNIAVPAPPQTTIRLEAVSRTNTGNAGTLLFRVTNTGANPTLPLNLVLQVTGASGLTFPNSSVQPVAPLVPGASREVTFAIALPAGQDLAAATLTANLQAFGNIPATLSRWRFDPPTAIVPLP
jgi:hypothetical protein